MIWYYLSNFVIISLSGQCGSGLSLSLKKIPSLIILLRHQSTHTKKMISMIWKYLKISFDGIETLMTKRYDASRISGVGLTRITTSDTLIFSYSCLLKIQIVKMTSNVTCTKFGKLYQSVIHCHSLIVSYSLKLILIYHLNIGLLSACLFYVEC